MRTVSATLVDPRISAAAAGMSPATALVTLLWEMPDVTVAILHPDGRGVVDVNDAVEDLTGIPRAEVIGLSSLKGLWLEANEWPQLLEMIQTAGTVAGHPFSVRHRSGEVRYAHLWARRCTMDGEPAVLVVAREATESLRTERLLATEHAVSEQLSRAGCPDDALTCLLASLGERLGWDAAVWWEAAGGKLRATVHWVSGMSGAPAGLDALLGATLTEGQGLAGRVLAGGRPLWLDDVMDDAGCCPHAAVAAGAGLRTTMAFPVRAGERTYGVAQLLMREKLPVDEALLETAAVLGRNTGLALRALR
jgi:PAS domain S-box-containing protein